MPPTWIHLFLDIPASRWERYVAFWAAATRGEVSVPRGEDGQFVTLLPSQGESWVKLQRVDQDSPRVHLDLDSDERRRATADALTLGATPAWQNAEVAVQRSPGGLLLCHTVGTGGRLARHADSVLDQVCIDVPAVWWEREVDFWQQVTGRPLEAGMRPEFVFLAPEHPERGLRILLQRLDEQTGPVRAHPDFAVADRAAETRRHLSLGARAESSYDDWTVLTAPDGSVYCLTDRDPLTGRVERP